MLTTTINKVIHNGNASATVWPYTFPIPDTGSLVVIYTDADGVETTLSTSEYSVTGIGTTTGGNVTYPLSGSAIATGTTLTIRRVVPYTQATNLENQGGYYPDVVEERLDLLTMQIQQVKEITDRAVVVPVTDAAVAVIPQNAAARANTALLFDGDGNPYAGTLVEGLAGVSAYVLGTFLPAASAVAARLALGFSAIAAKGDLLAGTALNTIGTLTAGTNDHSLVADSAETAGMKWAARVGAIRTQVKTSTGTYTPDANLIAVLMICIGAGGGGGGVTSASAGFVAGGGGGGGGGLSLAVKTAAQIGASQAVTIGAGGTTAAAGTATSVGSLCVANGGGAGVSGSNGGGGGGGAGAVTTLAVGDVTIGGNAGDPPGLYATIITVTGNGGGGAPGPWGGGALGPVTANSNGAAGNGYGGGGSGAYNYNSIATLTGGTGADGVAIFIEFCSA